MLERGRVAFLDLTTLGLSLFGFLGMIAAVLQLKSGVVGVPRLLFLTFLALSCAPFLSAFWRIPKPPYLIAPTVALFLLYPITGSPDRSAGWRTRIPSIPWAMCSRRI
ncbi:MAG: hypothetical protein E6J99_09460 [Methanobacteriota archaeon]|nr:MAG: hypothetical protein E6J99_09460 [Euryarchaeota archaeon]